MAVELTPLGADYYGIAWQKYLQYLRLDGPMHQRFVRHQLPVVVDKVWPGEKTSLALASFGCGSGGVDIDVLESISKRFSTKPGISGKMSLFVRALDPCKEFLEVYKSRYADNNDSVFLPETLKSRSTLEFEFCNETFQSYVTEYAAAEATHVQSRRHFDVVLFVHSLYYMPMERALMHCYNQELSETGVIVSFILGEDSPYAQVAQILKEYIRNDFVFSHAKTSKEIVKIAEANSWAYEEFDIPTCQEVTDILDKDSEDGSMALDFLTCCKNFRVTGNEECVTKVDSLIKSLSKEENGRRCINYSNTVVVIYKGR